MIYILIILTQALGVVSPQDFSSIFKTNQGQVAFISNAPLERIEAKSRKCKGVLDLSTKNFAFQVYIKSFEGFNSPLQRIHFQENYLEVEDFPEATFKGRIITNLSDWKDGTIEVKASGELYIHGVTKELIIPVKLDRSGNEINYRSTFEVALRDFNIKIPMIVKQKISENIQLEVLGVLNQAS